MTRKKDRQRSTDLSALPPPPANLLTTKGEDGERGVEDDVANRENSLNRFDGPRLVSLNPGCNLLLLLFLPFFLLILLHFASTSSSLSVSHLCARTSAAKKPWRLTRSPYSRVKDYSLPLFPLPPSLRLHDDNTEYVEKKKKREERVEARKESLW